ncbi:Pesticin receptor [BD1-7 clade bacterium]|uniref:Pesticin receptor n=1 Tax=BD1-7 clade bacterium TaxID=2029982 RepID=A0A5S9QIY2_9GAMM|nr:Pesticin receptor [BD1-7 clade bacterium]CAA0118803.1 Pesticin receptor [BD1-7 clade bacterium]
MKIVTYRKPLAVAIGLAAASYASAQDATENQPTENAVNPVMLEEVVVTAQKREQNLQDTPIAISTFDAQQLDDQEIRDISDISSTAPNVQIAPSPGGTTGATVTIRGVTQVNPAITFEPAVGIYFDGVFVAKNVGGLFDVAELERIEVLRGPQGTLYGKNTIGGAINLITRKPSEDFQGKINVGGGNYSYLNYGASIDTGRLGEVAAFTFAYNERKRDGFYENVPTTDFANPPIQEFNKLDSQSARAAVNFIAGDSVTIDYAFDWAYRNNTPRFGQLETVRTEDGRTLSPKVDRKDKGSLNGALYDRSRSSGHSLQVAWDINDELEFKSISAYRSLGFDDANDYDGTQYTFFHAQRHASQNQTSQEFQLIGNTENLVYVVGLYYFREKSDVVNPFDFTGAGFGIIENFYGVSGDSYAAFSQVDWLVTDEWTLTFGGRYTYETKDGYVNHPTAPLGYGLIESNDSWENFSPTLAVNYMVTDDVNLYFRAAQGWKAGGFNAEAATAEEARTPYKAETNTSYEVGMKARWVEDRIQTNVAVFKNDVRNMQLSIFAPGSAYSVVENAGEAEVFGFELESIFAITQGFNAYLNYGYLYSKYLDFVKNGEQLKDTSKFPYSPKNKVSLAFEYVTDLGFGQFRGRVDYSYVTQQYFYHDIAQATVTESPAYSLVNAKVLLADISVGGEQTIEVGVWGKNLTNEEYRINGIPANPSSTAAVNYYGDPRTFGADLTYRF